MDMATQCLLREVTLGKLKRDAENVRQYARFVIVLHDHDVTVIDNGRLREEGKPYARLVAVLGLVEYQETWLESVLMEIGYARTRPYAQIESGGEREKRADGRPGRRISRPWVIKGRARVRAITRDELLLVYPAIMSCMMEVVLEGREHWQHKEPWYTEGAGRGVARGIHFTVSRSDELFHQQMLWEDVQFRKKRYIASHGKRAVRYLKYYARSYYTNRQLRCFKHAAAVADVLSQVGYTPLYRAALIRSFKPGSHIRSLLERITEAFRLDVALTNEEEQVLSGIRMFPEFKDIHCYRPPDQPSRHARNGTVFEIVPSRRLRDEREVLF